MGDALLALWVFLVAPVVVLAAGAFVLSYSLRRANRVGPQRAGAAPLAWLWSPSPAAMLHRRLRSACQVVSASAATAVGPKRRRRLGTASTDAIAELAKEVISQAVQVDRELVPASRMARGAARVQALSRLELRVRSLEDAAARVSRLATRRAQLLGPTGPGELSLSDRIAALEAALGELSSS